MDIKSFQTFSILLCLFSGESCDQTVYGKIGENVYLHLRKSNETFFNGTNTQWKHQNRSITKPPTAFATVFNNGTLKLYNVRRNFSGNYTAVTYDNSGTCKFKESYHLDVIDPPVVELVACILDVPVLHCAGENGPDAVYEWRVSVQNQGRLKVSNHTGKYVALEYSTGNISCSLKKGNYSSQSVSYSLSCAGSGRLVPETQWGFILGVTVILVFLCFMTCGISVGVRIYRKRQNSNVKSEASGPSLEMTQDDGIVYSEVRVGKRHK